MESNEARNRTGYGKGIQGWNNSCYLDSLLMSLFYGSSCLDKIFLKEYSHSPNTQYSQKVSTLMSKVVNSLRSRNYCPKEFVLELRAKLAKVNPNITGEMEDVADFLQLLSKKGLNLDPFLIYTGGGSNFYHQIVLKHNPSNTQASIPSIVNLQHLFGESLSAQKIAIQRLNCPLLALKVPRANGVLVKHKGIFPPLKLEVRTSAGTPIVLSLQAVICLKHCHYTCFLRSRGQWVFYDSMAAGGQPEVKPLCEMERIMTDWSQRLPVSSSTGDQRLPVTDWNLYFRILTDIHMCFYVSPNVSKELGFYNAPPSQVMTQPRTNTDFEHHSQARTQARANTNLEHNYQARTPARDNTNLEHNYQARTQARDNVTIIRSASSSSRTQESSVLQVHRRATPIQTTGASSPISSTAMTTVLPDTMEHNSTPSPGPLAYMYGLVVSGYTSVKSKFLIFTKQFSYDLNNCLDALMEDGRKRQLRNNTFPRIGISQGIEMSKSFRSQNFALESLVFAMFSNTRRNDSLFCHIITRNSTPDYLRKATNMQMVVESLRYHPYLCSEELITKLYQSLRIPSSTVIDVADLALHLFKDAIPQIPFIRQGKNVSTFLHHIVVANDPRRVRVTTKQLLMLSMQYQKVSFLALHGPLFLRIQANILGGKSMVLDLTLQTSDIFSGMPPRLLSLIGFITRDKKGNYKSYTRYNSDQAGVKNYCWVSMGIREDGKPEVKACPYIEPQILKTHEMTLPRTGTSARSPAETEKISRIVKDIELLIYC